MSFRIRALVTASLSSLILASCGGSSSPSPTAVTPAPTTPVGDTGPTFTMGSFAPEADFVAQCESPRTGTDPSTGNPFVDTQGSTLIEKFWLRSWNDRTYLWYDEVTDVDPNSIADRLDYFDVLKTNAVTPSGAPRDQFHFTQDTAERFARVSTGSSAGYGGQYAFLASSPPRDVRVAFTEANSPFADANVVRGAKIVTINGEDVINGDDVDTLNAGLFPSGPGVETVFEIEDTPGAARRTVTVSSATIVSDPVLTSAVLDEGNDRVGYVVFNTFGASTAEEQLFETFTDLEAADVDDLVLDLRYNGGGFLAIASQLGYMIAGDQTRNQTFETLQFNDKFPTTDPVTGQVIRPTPFYDETLGFTLNEGTDLPTLNLDRVFILSTSGTCSASEAVINGLQGIDVEVILIGNTTCGKPYGFYTTDNCGVSYSTIQFRGVNAKNFGDYADGFSPGTTGQAVTGELVEGCVIPDDFSAQLGDTDESMLSAALTYRASGICPAESTAQSKISGAPSASAAADAAGPSLFDSPIYQLEMSYRQNLNRDDPPSLAHQDAK